MEKCKSNGRRDNGMALSQREIVNNFNNLEVDLAEEWEEAEDL